MDEITATGMPSTPVTTPPIPQTPTLPPLPTMTQPMAPATTTPPQSSAPTQNSVLPPLPPQGTAPAVAPSATPLGGMQKKKSKLLPILLVLLLAIGGTVWYLYTAGQLPFLSQTTPTPTPTQAVRNTTKGWVAWLRKAVYKTGEVDPSSFEQVGYVLVDNSGAYLRDISAAEASLFDPITIFNLQDSQDDKAGISIAYKISETGRYIVKRTITWSPSKESLQNEIARIDGKNPVFQKMQAGLEYLGDDGNDIQLLAKTSQDPKCNGMCPEYFQLYVQKPGAVPVAVGKKNEFFGSIVNYFTVPGKYVAFVTNSEGIHEAYLVDLTTMKLENITSKIVGKFVDIAGAPFAFNPTTMDIYYLSARGAKSLTISSYNIATKAVVTISNFTWDKNENDPYQMLKVAKSNKILYLVQGDTSSGDLQFTPIDLETRLAQPSVTLMGAYNNYGAPLIGAHGDMPGFDFTNELNPKNVDFKVHAVPGGDTTFDDVNVLGYVGGD